MVDHRPTLIMGARGNVGRLVLEQLLADGVPVRASARRPEPGWFAADLTDPASLRPAFDGMAQVFLYATHESAPAVAEAVRAAGVERVVLMSSGSVLHPTSAGNPITERHREAEAAFAAQPGVELVPIRPLVLATNALGWAHPIREGGGLPLYQPDALTAPIHERDVAAVVSAALTGTPTPPMSGMLTGPARLTQREQVAAIGRAAARRIPVIELSRDAALEHFSRFMPGEEAEAVLRFLDDAAAGNSPATSTVEEALRRPATGFDQWAADHAPEFQDDQAMPTT